MQSKYHSLVKQFDLPNGTVQAFCAMCGQQVILASWPATVQIPCIRMLQLESVRQPIAVQTMRDRSLGGVLDEFARTKRAKMLERSVFGRKVLKYLAARDRWVAAGQPMTSPDELEKRIAACAACPHRNPGVPVGSCGLCGCELRAKQEWATERCPDRRWGESPEEDCGCGNQPRQQPQSQQLPVVSRPAAPPEIAAAPILAMADFVPPIFQTIAR